VDLRLTKRVFFVYFFQQLLSIAILYTMDPSPDRECSHSTCHNVIPATEAGIKQYRTCIDCRVRDAATRKRKRHEAKAIAAQQATTLASAEASAGALAEDSPNGQKRQKILGPTIVLEDSNDEYDDVSIVGSIA
jgi:hypothetical protein